MAVLTTIILAMAMAGCGRTNPPQTGTSAHRHAPSTPATEFATAFQTKVTADAMMAHLKKLQEIADANGGNRALGTPGYAASVDYVANTLKDKGFDVKTDEFDVRLPFADEPSVTVGGQGVKAAPLVFTIGTPPDGVSGQLVPAREDDDPGCTASDYDGLDRVGRRRAGGPWRVPVLREADGGGRAWRRRDDRRQQRRRRRCRRHVGRAHRRARFRSSASPSTTAPTCGRTRPTPRSR